ncbi:signal recognition particle-docking protein FtsY [Helicobacter sp. 11S02629-2]|uniref:signal recognition particle-docking protein FtsY n=1 Tax=Helicobacter sp. 11S02629-2 TaxID=1476195 RepID=UPI000BA53468|nr:signal recognition particle-docking protein FtsY [Helicobacter sp. 11S02629-2]PAF44098.1 signal recognition particle-docking protein FtsY [Helicobacter sp. 11S02629-2]
MFNFLKKTKENLASIFNTKKTLIPKDTLEEILIESDIHYDIVEKMLNNLSENVSRDMLDVAFRRFFRKESYYDKVSFEEHANVKPLVYLILGVNGAGKTTTIAKLANMKKKEGKKVLLGAGDTFRAGAIEQLELWGKKLGIDVISTQKTSDPSALCFDAINAGIARKCDVIYIDTAGRLHNQTNLKNELVKISKTCAKALKHDSFHKLLILDGTQGSSAIAQAKIFHEMLELDGVVLTKMDGTSKGGCVFSIIQELSLPILYIGVGEKEDDLVRFDEESYINSLLDSIYQS